jgi:ubiquinone/menaquinone biosynthesis C-methylase UbiE
VAGKRSADSETAYVTALRFDWLTPVYDTVVRYTTRERAFKRALVEQAAFEPNQRVLDLACGTGTLAISIKQADPSVRLCGIDGDDSILTIAAKKARRAKVDIRFDRGLSYDLRYQDASFDRVVSTLFFHHLSWDGKCRTACEAYRVLAPGGELHVADWGGATGIMRLLFFFVQILDGFENTQAHVEGRLPEVFRGAGFDEVREEDTFSTVLGNIVLYRCVKSV